MLKVGDVIVGYGVLYRITEIIQEDSEGGLWVARVDGGIFAKTEQHSEYVRNGDTEARVAINPEGPLPTDWIVAEKVTAQGFNDEPQFSEDHIHATTEHLQAAIHFASRFALGNGLDRPGIARILEDQANAMRNPGDVAESTEPITLDWLGWAAY
jgi:hypothetical protein